MGKDKDKDKDLTLKDKDKDKDKDLPRVAQGQNTFDYLSLVCIAHSTCCASEIMHTYYLIQ